MIGYTTVGTNNLPRAAAFFDAVFAVVGIKQLMKFERGIGWGVSYEKPSFAVLTPFDKQPATVGNGTMISLVFKEPAQAEEARAFAVPPPHDSGFILCGLHARAPQSNIRFSTNVSSWISSCSKVVMFSSNSVTKCGTLAPSSAWT